MLPFRLRQLVQIILISGVVLLILGIAGVWLLGRALENFPTALQDCNGFTAQISGTVHDAANAQIAIRGEDGLYRPGQGVDLKLVTDAEGNFQSEAFHVFACEILNITVTAPGFDPQQIVYVLVRPLF